MVYFYNNLGNVYFMCILYATIPTLQAIVFLSLLRATHGVDGNFDLEPYFITGSIIGVCVAWIGVAPGVWEASLVLCITAASVLIFHMLLFVFEVGTIEEEEEEEDESTKKDLEYRLVIV
jgi:hypothetical protein